MMLKMDNDVSALLREVIGKGKMTSGANEILRRELKITSSRKSAISNGWPTNADRASWGKEAIDVFAARTGMDDDNEELPTVVGDLLADMMHHCHIEGVDFEECLRMGRMHFSEELEEERNG